MIVVKLNYYETYFFSRGLHVLRYLLMGLAHMQGETKLLSRCNNGYYLRSRFPSDSSISSIRRALHAAGLYKYAGFMEDFEAGRGTDMYCLGRRNRKKK